MQAGWKYYNHALIPTTEPHVEVVAPSGNCEFWKCESGICLFARWTSDFDCLEETDFWYVIKDTPFEISDLKAKKRYEINKGNKYFSVKKIQAVRYTDELVAITKMAYSEWPEKYRPTIDDFALKQEISEWDKKYVVYGGFDIETGEICAYSYVTEFKEHLEFNVLRVKPECEKNGINAAMVFRLLEDYRDRIGPCFYINDGARSIRHETAFQDYLEKYFGFRKAYCYLKIKYRPIINVLVKVLYPFRKAIKSDTKFGSAIASIMLMEEISRNT